MSLRNLGVSVLLLGVMTSIAGASARSELDLAAKQGQVAFILVTEPGTAGTAEAKAVVKQAMLRVKRSTLIELGDECCVLRITQHSSPSSGWPVHRCR
jgi:hypothetical protein